MACEEPGEEDGFGDERFQSPVPKILHCRICLKVLRHPRQCVRNEHTFCEPCIHRLLKTSEKCPVCMEPLTPHTLRPSRLAVDLLSKFVISCDNAGRGCEEFVELGSLNAHVASCGFSPVKCSNNGCEAIVNKTDFAKHEKNCQFRLVGCWECGKEVNHRKRKVHCYLTRKEMDEIKLRLFEARHEVLRIKLDVSSLRTDLKEHMDEVKDQICQMKQQIDLVYASKRIKQESKTNECSARFPPCCVRPSVSEVRDDIIVAGGNGYPGRLKSVELFNWKTGEWLSMPPMSMFHGRSSSFVFHNQIFVCGGVWSEESMEALHLTRSDSKWKPFPVKLPSTTCGHASVVHECRLLVFGGYKDGKAVDDIYEICLTSPYSSKRVGHMAGPRMFHGAQLFGDVVVIVGGSTTLESNSSCNSVLLYNIIHNYCTYLDPLPYCVRDMATVAWKDNIVVIGGWGENGHPLDSVVLYNITNEKSKMLPPMKHKRPWCTAVMTGDVIVVVGGYNPKLSKGKEAMSSVECFNVDTFTWEELPQLKVGRYSSTACVKTLQPNPFFI